MCTISMYLIKIFIEVKLTRFKFCSIGKTFSVASTNPKKFFKYQEGRGYK